MVGGRLSLHCLPAEAPPCPPQATHPCLLLLLLLPPPSAPPPLLQVVVTPIRTLGCDEEALASEAERALPVCRGVRKWE